MRDDRILGDDELRFVDVLLAEHFALTARATPVVAGHRAPPPLAAIWLAAAIVLGAVAIGGTWWLRHESVISAQDPTPRTTTPFEPQTDEELQAFLQQVACLRVQELEWSGQPYMCTGQPCGAMVATEKVNDLRAFGTGWSPTLKEPSSRWPWQLRVNIDGRDGRRVSGLYAGDLRIGQHVWAANAAVEQFLDQLHADSARAEATTVDDLRALPETRGFLDCTKLSAEDLQSELPRFRALSQLVITLDDRRAAVLASLPSVCELEIVIPPAAEGLTDTGWSRLATMPRLRRLRIAGDAAATAPGGIAQVAAIESLAIVGTYEVDTSCPVRLDLLAAIVKLPALVELRAAVTLDSAGPPDRMPQIFAELAAMPKLRRLGFAANTDPTSLWPALATSKIQKLQLGGFTIGDAAVDALAAMPDLRELDLRGAQFTAKGKGLLATLQQVSRLDLRLAHLTPPQLTDLRSWLPQCEVHDSPGRRGAIYTPLGSSPSWTIDD